MSEGTIRSEGSATTEPAVSGEGTAEEAEQARFRAAATIALQNVITQNSTQSGPEVATTITDNTHVPQETTVPQQTVTITSPTPTPTPTPPAEKQLTADDIVKMKASDIGKLTQQQVAHLSPADLVKAQATREQKSAFRLVWDSKAQEQQGIQEDKKRRATDWSEAFKSARRKRISIAGSCNKHYNGTEKGDWEFTKFVDANYRSVRDLITGVLGDSRVTGFCTFMASREGTDICEFRLDLNDYFDNASLRGMSIRGGVTEEGLSVFHAGPLGM